MNSRPLGDSVLDPFLKRRILPILVGDEALLFLDQFHCLKQAIQRQQRIWTRRLTPVAPSVQFCTCPADLPSLWLPIPFAYADVDVCFIGMPCGEQKHADTRRSF